MERKALVRSLRAAARGTEPFEATDITKLLEQAAEQIEKGGRELDRPAIPASMLQDDPDDPGHY